MEYIRVRNFEKFQHYKHRNPPWIRLYFELLGDRDFYKLSAKLKFQIIGLFLLASRFDNKIPADAEWIRTRIHSVETVNLQDLVSTGFIEVLATCKQDASNMLAGCKQLAITETDNSETDNSDSSETEGTETRTLAFGEFQNVILTNEEHRKLMDKLGEVGAIYWIEELSRAIASKGLKYKSHYATILTWEQKREKDEKRRETAAERKDRERAEINRRVLERVGDIRGLLPGDIDPN